MPAETMKNVSTNNSFNDLSTNSSNFSTDSAEISPILLGTLIGCSAVPGILANALLIFLIVYGKLLPANKSPIYKLILSLSVSDTVLLSGTAFYLSPSIALQDYLVSTTGRMALGAYFGVGYYTNITAVALIAINRHFAVCKDGAEVPSTRNVSRILFVAWPLFVVVSGFIEYISPYKFVYEYHFYSYAHMGCCGENLRLYIWELPQNIIVSLCSIYCYTTILIKMRLMGNSIADSGASGIKGQHKRRRREIRLAIQFCVITLVYILMWLLFAVFPVVLANVDLRAFAVVSFLMVANCSFNAIVNLSFNEEIHAVMKAIVNLEPVVPAAPAAPSANYVRSRSVDATCKSTKNESNSINI